MSYSLGKLRNLCTAVHKQAGITNLLEDLGFLVWNYFLEFNDTIKSVDILYH